MCGYFVGNIGAFLTCSWYKTTVSIFWAKEGSIKQWQQNISLLFESAALDKMVPQVVLCQIRAQNTGPFDACTGRWFFTTGVPKYGLLWSLKQRFQVLGFWSAVC